MDKLRFISVWTTLTRKEWIWNFKRVGLVSTLLEVSTKENWLLLLLSRNFRILEPVAQWMGG